jgi:hypothetical protein
MQKKRYRTQRWHQEYSGLEDELQSILRPVNPRPEFIGDLRSRLKNLKDFPDENVPDGAQFLLILAFSFLTVVAVVMMSIRVVLLMASALGMLQHYRRQRQQSSMIKMASK